MKKIVLILFFAFFANFSYANSLLKESLYKVPLMSDHIEQKAYMGYDFEKYIIWNQRGVLKVKGNNVVLILFKGKSHYFDGKLTDFTKVVSTIERYEKQITLKKGEIAYITLKEVKSNDSLSELIWDIFITTDRSVAVEKGVVIIYHESLRIAQAFILYIE